jgi:ubiquinone/menaquinone biosynthesis C-methylase UbiE
MAVCKIIKNSSDDIGWQILIKKYSEYANKNSFVIDIGGSDFKKTNQLAKKCKLLTIAEINPKKITSKNKLFENIIIKQGDWQALSSIVSLNKFNILVASHVIEHIPDDLKAINETYKVLKKGGKAFILTPNVNRLSRRVIELYKGKRKFPWKEHQREYTYDTFKFLINQSLFDNFKIESIGLGFFAAKVNVGLKTPPRTFRRFANYFLAILTK